MDRSIILDQDLFRQYCRTAPSYLCYPDIENFDPSFREKAYRACIQQTNEELIPAPLALSVHAPSFQPRMEDQSLQDSAVDTYLRFLYREIELQGALFDRDRSVNRLFWDANVVNSLSRSQMRDLMEVIDRNFLLSSDPERDYLVIIDPCLLDESTIRQLEALGFNHALLVISDSEPSIEGTLFDIFKHQKLTPITPTRSFSYTTILLSASQSLKQSGWDVTTLVDLVLDYRPDCIGLDDESWCLCTKVEDNALAATQEPFQSVIDRIQFAGYVHLGLNLFVLPDGKLAKAQRMGDLNYALGGFSVHERYNWIAFGPGGVGTLHSVNFQNAYDIQIYYNRIDAGLLPVNRGIVLSEDDLIRNEVLQQLICYSRVDINDIQAKFGILFPQHFESEMRRLDSMQEKEMISITDDRIRILPCGRLLVKGICRAFDGYI